MEKFEGQFNQPPLEQPKTPEQKPETASPAPTVEGEDARQLREQQDQQKLKELREQLGISEQKEGENFFDNLKRPYGVEDVKNFQQALAEFEEKRKKENAQYVFDYNNFYQFLTSFRKKGGKRHYQAKQKFLLAIIKNWSLLFFKGGGKTFYKIKNEFCKVGRNLQKL